MSQHKPLLSGVLAILLCSSCSKSLGEVTEGDFVSLSQSLDCGVFNEISGADLMRFRDLAASGRLKSAPDALNRLSKALEDHVSKNDLCDAQWMAAHSGDLTLSEQLQEILIAWATEDEYVDRDLYCGMMATNLYLTLAEASSPKDFYSLSESELEAAYLDSLRKSFC